MKNHLLAQRHARLLKNHLLAQRQARLLKNHLLTLLRASTVGLLLGILSNLVMIARPNSRLIVLAGVPEKFLFRASKALNSKLSTTFVFVSTAILILFRFHHHKYGLRAAVVRAQECLGVARKETPS